jgi:hypothetical protein
VTALGPLGAIAGTGFVPVVKDTLSPPAGSGAAAGLLPMLALLTPAGAGTGVGRVPTLQAFYVLPTGSGIGVGFIPTASWSNTTVFLPPLGAISGAGFSLTLAATWPLPAGAASGAGATPTLVGTFAAPLGTGLVSGATLSLALATPRGDTTGSGFAAILSAAFAASRGDITGAGIAFDVALALPTGVALAAGLVFGLAFDGIVLGAISGRGFVPVLFVPSVGTAYVLVGIGPNFPDVYVSHGTEADRDGHRNLVGASHGPRVGASTGRPTVYRSRGRS